VPFRPVRFEHPKTEQAITLRRKAYLWAGLFGAGYVAWIGYGNVPKALAINIGFGIGVLGLTFVTSTRYVTPLNQFLILVIALPLVVAIQGQIMISIVRTAFRRRGWMTRSTD
jgi:hypothetical protein